MLLGVAYVAMAQPRNSSNVDSLAHWDPAGLFYSDVWGYADPSGNEYAIIGSGDSIHFFKVNGTAPILQRIAAFRGGNNTNWREFKTYINGTQRYLYAICDVCSEGMYIFDLSNLPASVSIVPTSEFLPTSVFTSAHMLFVDEPNQRLYISGANSANLGRNGLIILSLANPRSPTVIFNNTLPGGYIHDMYVRNNIVYASSGDEGFYIFNFNNTNNPLTNFTVASEVTNGYNHSSWLTPDGSNAIIAEEVPNGLPLLSQPLSGINLNTTDNSFNPYTSFRYNSRTGVSGNLTYHNPYIKGTFMYVSAYHDGIQIWNYANPASPAILGFYDTYPNDTGNYPTGYNGAWGVYPYLPSGKLLASDMTYGLWVLQPTGAALPVKMKDITATLTEQNHVRIDWQTASEAYSKKFVVEHSTDAQTYKQIGEVNAAGHADNIREYALTDEQPGKGINYYRVKQVDMDNTFVYSNTVSVNILSQYADKITITVVANNLLQINSTELIDKPSMLELYTINGQLVFNATLNSLSSTATTVSMPNLPVGQYVVRISNERNSTNQTIFVAK